MSRPLTWSQLTPGLVILGVLATLTVTILGFARVGEVRGRTVRLYATMSAARDILAGSEVWLGGRKVGVVRTLQLQEITTDTTRRLVVGFDVLVPALAQLRRDSNVQIRPGRSMVGASVLWLTPGTPASTPLTRGDTLASQPARGSLVGFTARGVEALTDLSIVVSDVRALATELESARSTLSAFNEPLVTRELALLEQQTRTLATRAIDGDGARALAALPALVRQITADVDSLRLLLDDPARGSLGRFRHDSTLIGEITALHARVDSASALLTDSRGTLWRTAHDSALTLQLHALSRELGALSRDVKRHPLRYLAF